TCTVEDGILTRVAGLPGDPKGGGAICPKGASNPSHVYSAYRLKWPLIRENGRFRKADWDEALDKVAAKLNEMNPETVGYFRGNDFNNWLHEALFKAYGAITTTHRPMCDNAIRMQNEHNLNDKRPWIDYRESDYIIHWGINDSVTAYGRKMPVLLKSALKRGAKLVVFDVRRSENAEMATEWIAPKPATDGAVAMAMCYVIVKNGLYNKSFVKDWTHGFEDFKRRLLGEEDGIARTPEWAEKISSVPAITIERLAREFAAADRPATICWGGVAQTPNGFHATAAIHALNGLMGTFDAPGGPSLPFKRKLKSPWGEGQKPAAKKAPKPNKLNMWEGWAPAFFPKDVTEGKFKGLFCYWGSPVLSWSNQSAVVEAIGKLDFVVTMDAFMNNTATLSDVVIPSVASLEMDSLRADWLYDAFISSFQRAIEPLYNCRPEWWVFIELAKRLGLGEFFPWDDIEEALRNMLEGTPWDYDELKEKGFIITDKGEYYKYKKWGSFNTPDGYSSSGKTLTGKYNFKNPVAEKRGVDPLPDYRAPEDEYEELVPDKEFPFIFSNFRVFLHEHSSTTNNPHLMKLSGSNPLWINVLDAKKRAIVDGDKVVLESPWGKVNMRAQVTWNVRQGVVASFGGFGHWRGLEADPRYPQYGGANCGGLQPPNSPEKYGGNPLLKYFKVRVDRAD
ncbi:MAG TPA: molybdopterin-dependent oxidoreductase, partial [Clostridia bacterium]|nr:molybdopterin-dependent oxidoreductase [Clostridia bacterium]